MPLLGKLRYHVNAAGVVCTAVAGVADAAELGDPAPIGLEQVLQVGGGLVFVLFVIAIVAYAGRRLKGMHGVTGKRIRVLDGISVGARDRILLLEVESKKILIGLSPGRIRSLHIFEEGDRAFHRALDEAVRDPGEEQAA